MTFPLNRFKRHYKLYICTHCVEQSAQVGNNQRLAVDCQTQLGGHTSNNFVSYAFSQLITTSDCCLVDTVK